MANEKILAKKQAVIDEIKKNISDSSSIVLFDYRGITDETAKEIRQKLKESDADYKVYKNTLMARAFNELGIDLTESLVGPSAFAYSTDQLAPVKIISEFAKKHKSLVVKVGIIDGKLADQAELAQLAAIPSREGLLTMLAAGMMGITRDLAISLDLYSKQKEEV